VGASAGRRVRADALEIELGGRGKVGGRGSERVDREKKHMK
jgi:hypothetical protein